ncbi:DUF397 domain-containing protein [Spirillospora sp. NPDC048911]|uniref:DUF397 domain-containing protein n=1 Tax=Spirillospora sp. NPDC048911 TaxID=3364527 RepID=UPI00371BF336
MSEQLLSNLRWRKSSYSGGDPTDCVEIAGVWRKSSHSSGQGTECVEAAAAPASRLVLARDSKDASGPVLAFSRSEWGAFLGGVKRGAFDL